jgi:uncharacterized protein YbjQ (UPF0145 family)
MPRADFITTGTSIAGHRVVREVGIATGIIVRSRSVVGNFFGAIQTIFGGNITIYTSLCQQAREDAFQLMIEDAKRLGGNAIIAFRYDTTEVMPGLTEVLAYGTAVIVEPEGARPVEAAPSVRGPWGG